MKHSVSIHPNLASESTKYNARFRCEVGGGQGIRRGGGSGGRGLRQHGGNEGDFVQCCRKCLERDTEHRILQKVKADIRQRYPRELIAAFSVEHIYLLSDKFFPITLGSPAELSSRACEREFGAAATRTLTKRNRRPDMPKAQDIAGR